MLDQWLDRNTTYDKALRGLYVALNKVGGRVTKRVRDAIAAEKVARERLPPDSRGLILIIADIGRGGMNKRRHRDRGSQGHPDRRPGPGADSIRRGAAGAPSTAP